MSENLCRGRRSISSKHILTMLTEQNNTCPYCGGYIDDDREVTPYQVEHVFPYLLYKWSEYNDNGITDNDTLHKVLCSDANTLIAHTSCNLRKDSIIPNEYYINKMFISDEKRNTLLSLLEYLQPVIDWFQDNKKSIVIKQRFRCYHCRRNIDAINSTLRRIDSKKFRYFSNAMVLCKRCSGRLKR